ncbi:MAG: sialate O-acetylesterase [Mucilaginibacter sp.]|nr:sialate O-acetylesterase [Mucilaginibacter sp.]
MIKLNLLRNKYLIAISLIFNLIDLCFAVRRLYYQQQDADPRNPKNFYRILRAKLLAPIPIKTTDIIFIGDSEIEYFNTSELLPQYPIKNRGIAGDGSQDVYNRIGDVIKWHPRKLFIEIGTNDIGSGQPVDAIAKNMIKIIGIVKHISPHTTIYIQSVLPRGINFRMNVIALNEQFKLICEKTGCTYINVYRYFQLNGLLKKEYDCGDGLHLNSRAYQEWVEIIKPYLTYQRSDSFYY